MLLAIVLAGCASSNNNLDKCSEPKNADIQECKPRRISPIEHERIDSRLKEIADEINNGNNNR